MSTLMVHLKGRRLLNKTLFPPHLYVYDDLLVYKKRQFHREKEITISYNQIAHFSLNKGIFFSHIDIVTTGTDDISIGYLSKKEASQAKKIVDQKIYHAHAKHRDVDVGSENSRKGDVGNFEKSLNRLKELMLKGQISEKEYEKRKSILLKTLD